MLTRGVKFNTIWEIKDKEGNILHSQEDVSMAAVSYFQKSYRRNENCMAEDIFWGIDPFPTMFEEEQNDCLFQSVSDDEILSVMKSFKKDKCPGPDGWMIEFFIHFFDLVKMDILSMVEESRMSGKIHQYISSTYISLIPKKENATSFLDFKPISLCNAIYKIISKIIAGRIQGTLSKFISQEQNGFLQDRSIHDAVANSQESLHSLHTKNLDATILQIDLRKAKTILIGVF